MIIFKQTEGLKGDGIYKYYELEVMATMGKEQKKNRSLRTSPHCKQMHEGKPHADNVGDVSLECEMEKLRSPCCRNAAETVATRSDPGHKSDHKRIVHNLDRAIEELETR